MACGLLTQLLDNTGQTWKLSVDAGNHTVATLQPGVTGKALVLRAYPGLGGGNVAFTITLVNGFLQSASANFDPSLPTNSKMSSVSGDTFLLVVDNGGMLFTIDMQDGVPDAVLGQLIGFGLASYPKAVQPGGPGTPVTSPAQGKGGGPLYAQLPNESMGKFTFGCGHFSNHISISRQSVACQPSVLCCCPLCGWLARVMSIEDFDNNLTNPIILV